MDRMKTFLLYALGIVGFIFLSTILEDGLLDAMYVRMTGSISPSNYGVSIDDVYGRATNVNGNMRIKLTNKTENENNLYLKIDLFSKQDLLATTKYIKIISLFGWEIDLGNVFGMDLTNATIFGVKLTDIFSVDSIKTAGSNAWDVTVSILNSVPWWGYAIAGGIVLWYLPSGYLFGII